MVRSILHIGAHRTGTSSLQKFLRDNTDVLESSGINILCPPESRAMNTLDVISLRLARESKRVSSKIVISEENLLGTMGHNALTKSLYPNAKPNLEKLAVIHQPDVVMLSIRELGEYWTSSILFSLSRKEIPFPSRQELASISDMSRTWIDVVEDIQSVFSNSRLVVREFTHLTDNPKRFLKVSTNWQGLNEAKLNRRPQNMRPGAEKVVSILLDRGDFNALSRLGNTKDMEVFSKSQRRVMYEAYQDDLNKLRKNLGPSLLEGKKQPEGASINEVLHVGENPPVEDHKTVFLHIGKTGGSFLKSLATTNSGKPESLYLGNHSDTLISSIKNFGRKRRLAFFFRDPEARFISGFYSRMRQGRPKYNVSWTPAEAVAFSFFHTPHALAEALYSQDERLKSAARFAMASIFHLKHGYEHYLHSPNAIQYEMEAGNIVVCCETAKIDTHLGDILKSLHIPASSSLEEAKNSAPDPVVATFSEIARENLKKFCVREFEIYAACKKVAKELGFHDEG